MSTNDQIDVSAADEDIEMPDWEDTPVRTPSTVCSGSSRMEVGSVVSVASAAAQSSVSFVTTMSGTTYHARDLLPDAPFSPAVYRSWHADPSGLVAPVVQRVSPLLHEVWDLTDPLPSRRVQIMTDQTMTRTPEATPESYLATEEEVKNTGLPFPRTATDPTLADLREISSMASWRVSSSKPGCGVDALRNPTTATFWQSDGPQPHFLNVHFIKMVHIVKLRFYLDFELDESYTPTRISFCAGTHDYDAIEFAEWRWQDAGPKGWIDVDLSQCGSEEDHRALAEQYGNDAEALKGKGVLHCMFLQVRVLENHQNGKDTHIRGVQVFARDERVRRHNPPFAEPGTVDARIERLRQELEEADWMKEPELR